MDITCQRLLVDRPNVRVEQWPISAAEIDILEACQAREQFAWKRSRQLFKVFRWHKRERGDHSGCQGVVRVPIVYHKQYYHLSLQISNEVEEAAIRLHSREDG
ncbi:hypothetical protein M513_01178 [Trichuris suis]|uniref:Uncharacterized protein n=1 Tax=Trichuris suis TaxID=68888 RepID=A0A085ML49_9BILA|nr:hypothetical protein M513_01178 [Trichuris suis]